MKECIYSISACLIRGRYIALSAARGLSAFFYYESIIVPLSLCLVNYCQTVGWQMLFFPSQCVLHTTYPVYKGNESPFSFTEVTIVDPAAELPKVFTLDNNKYPVIV